MPYAVATSEPSCPDSLDAPTLRWGVLGTGWIADRFVASLRASTRQVVHGRRVAQPRRRRAGPPPRWGADHAHGSYEALVADPEVDVVYVATPHNLHLPHALLAIAAGKHVLVEKPVGLDAGEARAHRGRRRRDAGVFCMEAMWTLFLPQASTSCARCSSEGWLGRAARRSLADMGEWFDDDHRIMRADLAGGPLLDLGTYPVTLATWALGAPDDAVRRRDPGTERHQRPAVDRARHAGRRHGRPAVHRARRHPRDGVASPAATGASTSAGPSTGPGRWPCTPARRRDPALGRAGGRPRRACTSRRRRSPAGSRPARPGHPCGRGPTRWRPSRSWTACAPRPASTSPRRWPRARAGERPERAASAAAEVLGPVGAVGAAAADADADRALEQLRMLARCPVLFIQAVHHRGGGARSRRRCSRPTPRCSPGPRCGPTGCDRRGRCG